MLKVCNNDSTEPFLLHAEQPKFFQPFFIAEAFQPLDVFMVFFGSLSIASCPPSAWDSRAGYSTAGEVWEDLRGRIPSLNLLDTILCFWAVNAHCWLTSIFSSTSTPRAAGLLSILSCMPILRTPVCQIKLYHGFCHPYPVLHEGWSHSKPLLSLRVAEIVCLHLYSSRSKAYLCPCL